MYKRKARVLFLGTGNAGGAQMAEGYANSLGKDWIEAKFAGIEEYAKDPGVISIMLDDGIDISNQESMTLSAEILEWADLLVSVGAQKDEIPPYLPDHVRKKHWPLEDPTKATASDEEIITALRSTRDEVKRRVISMINGMKMLQKSHKLSNS